jgi:HPt (histidine-containing phosphotransfer) domain-containing protein
LLDRLNGDQHLLRELIEVFEADCPRMQEAIKKAVAAGDASALRIAAHKVKGSVANFSAIDAHAAALRLENLARQENLRAAPAAAAALDKELDRLKRALKDLERSHA